MKNYLNETPFPDIIESTFSLHFETNDDKQYNKISKLINHSIEWTTWDQIERASGPLISYFNQVLDACILPEDKKKDFIA